MYKLTYHVEIGSRDHPQKKLKEQLYSNVTHLLPKTTFIAYDTHEMD